jgi:hypothetical protein
MLFETAKEAGSSIDWDALTAIGTLILAALTATMAWYTARMASLTRQAILDGQEGRRESNDHFEKTRTQDSEHFEKTRAQDREHHQDSFRPLLVLAPSDPADAILRKDIVFSYSSGSMPVVFVHCMLRNIGSGPALNVRLSVRSDKKKDFGPSRELAPIAANGEFTDGGKRIEIPVIYNSGFNDQDFNNLPNGLWLLVLEYQDVFGNTFHTIHSKDLSEPWTRVDRGPAPDLAPEQPGLIEHVASASREDVVGSALPDM